MSGLLKTSSTKRLVLFLVFLVAADLSIFLGTPIFRQFLIFLFFTIVPGLLIFYILKLNKLDLTEEIALSVGLSISFLMLFRLLISRVYPFFGYDTPLSTNSLTISFVNNTRPEEETLG